MAYTRTFAQLSNAVAQVGGWENSADVTSSVLLQAINYGLLRGYDAMVGKWADYYTTSTTFAIVAGTDTYALATVAPNFYKLRHLDVSEDGQRFIRCYPHDLDIAHRYSGAPASTLRRIRYRIQASNLIFAPVPPAGQAKVYYIPLGPQFTSTSDVTPVTFDVPAEELLVVHYAHRDILIRSDLDPAPAERQIAEHTAQLRTAADSRDAGEPFYLDPAGPRRQIYGFDDPEAYF